MPRVIFIERGGKRREIEAPVGASLLDVAETHGIDIEGTCEGELACATCHVIVDEDWFDRLPEASEDEADMLDLVYELAATSRLGCQITLTEALDGLTVALPGAVRDLTNE